MAEQQDKHEATLLICGRLHGDRLAAILRRCGLDAEVIDLADQEWFSDDWENVTLSPRLRDAKSVLR
jgi:hypothetical protein